MDEFWKEATRTGTPIIESVKDSPRKVVVTFVWRADVRTETASVQAPNMPAGYDANAQVAYPLLVLFDGSPTRTGLKEN